MINTAAFVNPAEQWGKWEELLTRSIFTTEAEKADMVDY